MARNTDFSASVRPRLAFGTVLKGRQVTVIGAGIAGLSVAVAMAQHGAKVRVLERSPKIAVIGAGVQISPNGFVVLDALGLGAEARHAGLETTAIELKDYRAGWQVLRIDLTKRRSRIPFLLVHRARLIGLLEELARKSGVDVAFGVTADPSSIDGSLVLGADGFRSKTRKHLNGPEVPLFTGQVAWRAVVADKAEPEVDVWMGPGRHLVSYALDAGLRNIVAVEERRQWAAEDWNQADDPANLRAAFASFDPVVRHWLARVDEVRLWGLFRHAVAERWHDGRLALLGDAAHPTLPFLAQGANLALEDAWVMTRCLDRLPQKEALAEYQRRRRARAVRVVAAATANARNFHLRNPLLRTVAHATLRVAGATIPQAALNRFGWLYDFDVTRE